MGCSESQSRTPHLERVAENTFVNYERALFTHKMVLSRALDGQVGYEVTQGFADCITLGCAELRRATAGNAYHWWFVCRGAMPDGRNIFYVTQFGQNGRRAVADIGRGKNLIAGVVVHQMKEVEDMGTSDKSRTVWIRYPNVTSESLDRIGNEILDEQFWQVCSQKRTLRQLEALVAATPSFKEPYNWISNNCQHFANYLFQPGQLSTV